MFRLKIERGGPKGKTFDLPEGETIVGRSRKANVQLPVPDVSAKHVRIRVSQGKPIAENLSQYGTKIDQRPLAEAIELHQGQRLYIGLNTVLLVEEAEDLQTENEFAQLSQAGNDQMLEVIVKARRDATGTKGEENELTSNLDAAKDAGEEVSEGEAMGKEDSSYDDYPTRALVISTEPDAAPRITTTKESDPPEAMGIHSATASITASKGSSDSISKEPAPPEEVDPPLVISEEGDCFSESQDTTEIGECVTTEMKTRVGTPGEAEALERDYLWQAGNKLHYVKTRLKQFFQGLASRPVGFMRRGYRTTADLIRPRAKALIDASVRTLTQWSQRLGP